MRVGVRKNNFTRHLEILTTWIQVHAFHHLEGEVVRSAPLSHVSISLFRAQVTPGRELVV